MSPLPARGSHRAFGRSIGGKAPSTGFAALSRRIKPSYLPAAASQICTTEATCSATIGRMIAHPSRVAEERRIAP
jgi:hypothetical protein